MAECGKHDKSIVQDSVRDMIDQGGIISEERLEGLYLLHEQNQVAWIAVLRCMNPVIECTCTHVDLQKHELGVWIALLLKEKVSVVKVYIFSRAETRKTSKPSLGFAWDDARGVIERCCSWSWRTSRDKYMRFGWASSCEGEVHLFTQWL